MNPSAATKTDATFEMSCSIKTTIQATPEKLWSLLTDAAAFPSWNSTVSQLDGKIADGQVLALRVPSAPKRVFKPKVAIVTPGRVMTWSDGMAPMFRGVRTFTLTPVTGGATEFSMSERFSGLMLPMIKGSLPDFGPVFETYAADLKRAAEGRA